MDIVEASQLQPKQERLRTRWTASLDKIFADLVVEQIQLGNRPNSVFDKKTWNHIRDEFNKQTDLNFNNNQLRKHLDVLRTRFHNLKSATEPNDFAIEDSCCIGFDLWEEIAPKPEMIKTKDCPIYDQLCTIFAESGGIGKYAQSSHYEEFDKSIGVDTPGTNSCPETPMTYLQGNTSSAEKGNKFTTLGKKRPLETLISSIPSKSDHETKDAIAEAIFEMLDASKIRTFLSHSRTEDRFTITNCIEALDEIKYIHNRLYFAALDVFEDPTSRESFILLGDSENRLRWLQQKCGFGS